MAKPTISATTTATVTTTVNLTTKAKQLLKARAEEHAGNAAVIASKKARNKAIEKEVDYVFTKEKQGGALADGTKVDGNSFKLVTGKTKHFDQLAFMKKHGVTQEDFDEFTTYTDNEPYIKISVPKVKGE